MKNLTLLIVIMLTIFSCSPKYTASFQNYNRSHSTTNQIIDHQTELVSANEETQSVSIENNVPDETLTASTTTQPGDFILNPKQVKSTELQPVSKEERKALKKEIKSEIKSAKQETKKEKRGNESWNIFAYLGFGLSLIGMILGIAFPPLFFLLIPGIIFSGLGLASQKKGWAIAGLLVPIVIAGTILLLFALGSWGW